MKLKEIWTMISKVTIILTGNFEELTDKTLTSFIKYAFVLIIGWVVVLSAKRSKLRKESFFAVSYQLICVIYRFSLCSNNFHNSAKSTNQIIPIIIITVQKPTTGSSNERKTQHSISIYT